MLSRNYGNGPGRSAVNVPEKIKCKDCKTTKGSSSFSTKQLEILQKKLRDVPIFDAAKMPHISCTCCTSQQVVELECQGCERSMGLDKFYKAQRKTPDNAYCIKCVTERIEDEPYQPGRDDDENEYHGSEHGGSEGSGDDEYDDHYTGTTGGIAALSVDDDPSTFPSQNGGSTSGGVRLNTTSTAATSVQRSSGQTASNTGTGPAVRAPGSFNPSAYGGGRAKKADRGAWAKVPSGKAKPKPKPKPKFDSDDEDKELISDSD